jgi:F-type H+-transporting ATPase subunit a
VPEKEETGQEAAPKKGCLGCSFPLIVGLSLVLLALFVVGLLAGPVGQGFLNRFGVSLSFPSWLTVSRPDPHLPAETVFHIFGFPIANSVIAAWITIVFLVGFSYAITRRMKLVPGRLQAIFEFLVGWLHDLCTSVAGEENGRRFFPVVATIFLFVAFNAWLALLIPGFGSITVHTAEGEVHLLRAANTDITMPLALALTSFAFYWYFGFKALGIRLMKTFVNFDELNKGLRQLFKGKLMDGLMGIVTGFMTLFAGALEFLSVCIRVISLTFRLFGNMTAGEILVFVLLFLISMLSFLVLPLYGLELLIGFIQAIIFGGLTLIYLTTAVQSHQEEAH